jgi:hypothetical protein
MATVSINSIQPISTKEIEQKQTFHSSFTGNNRISVIEEILPFRVRFTSIQIPGFSPSIVPPIPLQVIGFSNYIL